MDTMTRYADPGRCPDCTELLTQGADTCPHCSLPLRGSLAHELWTTLTRADELLGALRASAAAVVASPPAVATVAPPAMGGASPFPAIDTGAVRPSRSRQVSGASVPQLLLGLGALCLLVAALVFLAVTWSVMGVGGRTATLVGLTAVAASVTALVAGKALRGATEALGLVTLGLVALDVAGADHARWFGDLAESSFLVVLGAVLVVTATGACLAVRATPARSFTSGEVVAGLGWLLVLAGTVGASTGPSATGALVVTLLTAAGTATAHRLQLELAAVAVGCVTLLAWLLLLATGLEALPDDRTADLTLAHVWGDLAAWPLVAAALLVGALALLPAAGRAVGGGALSVGVAILAFVVVCPALDDGATPATLAVLTTLAVALAASWVLPRRWTAALVLTAALGTAYAGGVALLLVQAALDRLSLALSSEGSLTGRFPAAGSVAGLQPWLLLPAAGLTVVAVLVTLRYRGTTAPLRAGVVTTGLATVTASAFLHPVPVWVVVAGLLVAGVVLLVVDELVAAAAVLGAATFVATYSDGLTAIALAVLVVTSAWVHLHDRRDLVVTVAGGTTAAALAASVWSWGDLLDRPGPWTAAVGIVVVAVLALTRTRAGTDLGAVVGVLGLAAAGLDATPYADSETWTAVYLTLAGGATCAEAVLRAARRDLAWAGGLLLAGASWVRLADVGVQAPEPYTLPAAVALLVVGVLRLRRHAEDDTVRALGPGLGLALVPSLLWVLADPVTERALLLGLACLGLVVAGLRLRWTAPLLFGALVGAAIVVRSAAPYVGDAVPRWATIGTAGVLLVALGITWEQRVREARTVLGAVRQLR